MSFLQGIPFQLQQPNHYKCGKSYTNGTGPQHVVISRKLSSMPSDVDVSKQNYGGETPILSKTAGKRAVLSSFKFLALEIDALQQM